MTLVKFKLSHYPRRAMLQRMFDLFIRPDRENAKAVYAVLAKFSAPLAGLTADDFIEGDKDFRTDMLPPCSRFFPKPRVSILTWHGNVRRNCY